MTTAYQLPENPNPGDLIEAYRKGGEAQALAVDWLANITGASKLNADQSLALCASLGIWGAITEALCTASAQLLTPPESCPVPQRAALVAQIAGDLAKTGLRFVEGVTEEDSGKFVKHTWLEYDGATPAGVQKACVNYAIGIVARAERQLEAQQ